MAKWNPVLCQKWINVTRIVAVCQQEFFGEDNEPEVKPGFWQILYTDRGTCRLQVDGRAVLVKQGQFLLTSPGSRCKPMEQISSSLRVFRLLFTCDAPREFLMQGRVFTADDLQKNVLREILHRSDAVWEPLGQGKILWERALRPDVATIDLQMIQNRLESFLITLWEKQNPRNMPAEQEADRGSGSLAVRIESFLREHLTGKLTLEQVGNHFGVSVSYVKQVFGAHYGHGIVAHWNRLRIEEAKRLIHSTDMNFSQIGERLGFSSVHYFSRLFHAITGMSPSEYSRSLTVRE